MPHVNFSLFLTVMAVKYLAFEVPGLSAANANRQVEGRTGIGPGGIGKGDAGLRVRLTRLLNKCTCHHIPAKRTLL
jgi:hypothetical protein